MSFSPSMFLFGNALAAAPAFAFYSHMQRVEQTCQYYLERSRSSRAAGEPPRLPVKISAMDPITQWNQALIALHHFLHTTAALTSGGVGKIAAVKSTS